jgi:LysM repeat protein
MGSSYHSEILGGIEGEASAVRALSRYAFVERGQSLDAIAKTYHVAKQRIIAANKLTPPFTLKPGLVLAIPLSAIEAAPPSQKTATTKLRPAAADADVPKRARPKHTPDAIPLD